MMKHIFILYILLCIYGCFSKPPELNTGHEGKSMPEMKLLMLDSINYLNTKLWKQGKPVVLIDISPYCPYCRAMTQKIIDDNKSLSDIEFVLISTFPLADLKNLNKEYQLMKYPNIILARDLDGYFGQYFNSPGVPCSAIYGKDRLLKRVLMGKSSIDVIKDIISE